MELLKNRLEDQLLSSYHSYPAYEKREIKRGYIYILRDDVFPEYIKIGMTRDLAKRYRDYNQHKPFNTAEFIAVSEVFNDVVTVEKKILAALVKEITPIGAKKEWFEAVHEDRLKEIVEEAEQHFHLYMPSEDI